ncbi:YbaY family lipoprotein [Paraferrimonas sedimenticola]|uniref:DUF306 domain-containing protein n=1 Tax=Paraferrimonas sedimenticola TaxID=375674 RepID=A0AA37RUQ3_9GAMM|nr:YbaY family lipoprotein [Paraferrimonas sedimenticola]GLP95538.1 hypothetical protein GCM10007895_08440 [Paraferrimonas sedimenticola]
MGAPSILRSGILLALVAGVAACQPNPPAQSTTPEVLTGEVYYREKIKLPEDATLQVYLEDVSLADAPSQVLAHAEFNTVNAPPYPFEFAIQNIEFKNNHRYALRARIEHNGRLMYTNDEYIAAFDENKPHRQVLVKRVQSAMGSLYGVHWQFESLSDGELASGEQGRAAYLEFDQDQQKVGGFNGCNSFNGAIEQKGKALSFGLMASTMKMCAEGSELERQVSTVLGKTQSFNVKGQRLQLLDDKQQPLAQLKAVTKP